MKTLKLSRKKESASLSLFLISKSPDGYAILLPKRAGTWNAKFHFGLHEGVNSRMDVLRTDDFLRIKISWMHSLQIFLPMVLRCARFARESSATSMQGPRPTKKPTPKIGSIKLNLW